MSALEYTSRKYRMKKVIFLDFDGVLNTEGYQAALHAAGEKGHDRYGPLFDPDAVENLSKILDAVPEALIVISSSWKLEGLERIREMWKFRRMPGHVHDITQDYLSDPYVDLEAADDYRILVGRGNEIRRWIAQNASRGCKYVILDDLPDFLPEQSCHLVITNPYTGITSDDAINAIGILTKAFIS
ncbi:MAG: hypothetical protein IJL61_07305 [Bacteroidales bacterium]|nr:hypothetical protein [Bacteroidales bacterium]